MTTSYYKSESVKLISRRLWLQRRLLELVLVLVSVLVLVLVSVSVAAAAPTAAVAAAAGVLGSTSTYTKNKKWTSRVRTESKRAIIETPTAGTQAVRGGFSEKIKFLLHRCRACRGNVRTSQPNILFQSSPPGESCEHRLVRLLFCLALSFSPTFPPPPPPPPVSHSKLTFSTACYRPKPEWPLAAAAASAVYVSFRPGAKPGAAIDASAGPGPL